jgi:hypothetical protein
VFGHRWLDGSARRTPLRVAGGSRRRTPASKPAPLSRFREMTRGFLNRVHKFDSCRGHQAVHEKVPRAQVLTSHRAYVSLPPESAGNRLRVAATGARLSHGPARSITDCRACPGTCTRPFCESFANIAASFSLRPFSLRVCHLQRGAVRSWRAIRRGERKGLARPMERPSTAARSLRLCEAFVTSA